MEDNKKLAEGDLTKTGSGKDVQGRIQDFLKGGGLNTEVDL